MTTESFDLSRFMRLARRLGIWEQIAAVVQGMKMR